MLEFWQNGMKIGIDAIYENGKVGQTVIYGQRCNWGEKNNPTIDPLSHYPCPSIFTIVEKKGGNVDGYYILSDSKGNRIKLKCFCSNVSFLYDAQEWLTWNDMHEKEKLSRKQKKIDQLGDHFKLLKDILIKQGACIVTKAQAEDLGIQQHNKNSPL